MRAKNPEQLRDWILNQKPTPTDHQKEAIFAPEREFFLRASPGSGKTWTSCRRFLWQYENWSYPAGGLALLSFTNTAIKEFQAATAKAGRSEALSEPNYIGTFDSFVEKYIIQPFGHRISGKNACPKLLITPTKFLENNSNLKIWAQTKDGGTFPIPIWDAQPTLINGSITWIGNKITLDKESAKKALKNLINCGYYAHSHRNFLAYGILKRETRLAEILARRFPEIIVDEAQDTSVWLIQILKLLRQHGSKITLIGDPDQCIFEFSMASPSALNELSKEWTLVEKPLPKSFRCCQKVAEAVRNISCNNEFIGNDSIAHAYRRAYVLGYRQGQESEAIRQFQSALSRAELEESTCAVLCRGHAQLASLTGESPHLALIGIAKDFADAAFARDHLGDYITAYKKALLAIRKLTNEHSTWDKVDEDIHSSLALTIKGQVWAFVRDPAHLPPLKLCWDVWVTQLKNQLKIIIPQMGLNLPSTLGVLISKRGIVSDQLSLPLFQSPLIVPKYRRETIHAVKGESIDGVLLWGSSKFFDVLVKHSTENTDNEERRLGYVGMTRARHLLVVAVPETHLKKSRQKWIAWGFEALPVDPN